MVEWLLAIGYKESGEKCAKKASHKGRKNRCCGISINHQEI